MILAQLLRAYISVNDTSIRAVANQIGIESTNLWRIVHGQNTRADNVLKIVAWMLTESNDQMLLSDQKPLNGVEESAQKAECPLSNSEQ